MRQLGWKVEPMQLVLRPGSAFWTCVETEPGYKLPAGDSLELRIQDQAPIAPDDVVEAADRSEVWFRLTAPQVNAILLAIKTSRRRGVSLWYTSATEADYEYWAGEVVSDT